MRLGTGWTRIGRNVLLIALAVQAMTPDLRDLSSPWLMRLLACKSAESNTGAASSPLRDQDDDGSDEAGVPVGIDGDSRVHLDDVARRCAAIMAIPPREPWLPTSSGWGHRFRLATQRSHDRIRGLCRFLF